MNRSQQNAFKARIAKIVARSAEKETDQVEWRIESRDSDDSGIWFQIETRVTNPEDDFESGWAWADGFGIGPRGKIYG